MSILNRKITMLNPRRRGLGKSLLKISPLRNRTGHLGTTAKRFRNIAPGKRDRSQVRYVLQSHSELDDPVANLRKITLYSFYIFKVTQLVHYGRDLSSARGCLQVITANTNLQRAVGLRDPHLLSSGNLQTFLYLSPVRDLRFVMSSAFLVSGEDLEISTVGTCLRVPKPDNRFVLESSCAQLPSQRSAARRDATTIGFRKALIDPHLQSVSTAGLL